MSPTVSDYEVTENKEATLPIARGPQPPGKFSVHSLGDRDWALVSICNPYPMILRGLNNCDAHLMEVTLKLRETWLPPRIYACGYLLVQPGVLDKERQWEGNWEPYKVPGFPQAYQVPPKGI